MTNRRLARRAPILTVLLAVAGAPAPDARAGAPAPDPRAAPVPGADASPGATPAVAPAAPAAAVAAAVPAALPDPASFAVGGIKLGMTPQQAIDALHGRDKDLVIQQLREPTADGHGTYLAALLVRQKMLAVREMQHPAPLRPDDHPAREPAKDGARPVSAALPSPLEQMAVAFTQFGGNLSYEVIRIRRYDPGQLVDEDNLRRALRGAYGLVLPEQPEGHADDPVTLGVLALPQTVTVPVPAAPVAATPLEGTGPAPADAAAAPAADAPGAPAAAPAVRTHDPAAPADASVMPTDTKTEVRPATITRSCASVAHSQGFDLSLLATTPGLTPMPLWTGFVPGCGLVLAVAAHRLAHAPDVFDSIAQHLVDQRAVLADIAAAAAARKAEMTRRDNELRQQSQQHQPSL